VKNNPPGRTTAQEHPAVKDNLCPQISIGEREAIGLPAPTWVAADGKVQPAVREALEQQRKLIESGDPLVGFQGDRPCGFQGTAYVAVYLHHERKGEPTSKENQAAVQEAQRRLLQSLTAREFTLIFAFKSTAGVVGYADEAAVRKLADDPNVIAVGLDDQPRPETKARLAEEPGAVGSVRGPVERRGKVEVDVYKVLERSQEGYAEVCVVLRYASLGPGESAEAIEAQDRADRELQDRMLSSLTAEEFRVKSRAGTSLEGYVNEAGLGKLAASPDVTGVGAARLIRGRGR
jgi:hypothetical protein